MTRLRWVVFGSLLAASIAGQPAAEAGIFMPAGSTVWMSLGGHACPGDNVCTGSNQPGANPPNGIPMSTFADGLTTATGFAEILPDRVRSFIKSNGAVSMFASFEDTYTVGGTATGPFSITVDLRATGTARSETTGGFTLLGLSTIEVEIGDFSPESVAGGTGGLPFLEQFRITPFGPSNRNAQVIPSSGGFGVAPFSVPIDVATSYTRTVSVGDVFSIGYGVNSSKSALGEIDLLDTATIGFDLPEGVFLTSALAQSLVPEPGGLALLAAGLSLASIWSLRRR